MPQPRTYDSHAARQRAYRRRQEQARQTQLRDKGIPPLPPIASIPGHARWSQAIRQATCLLTMVADEMQDYFDERSEAWQDGERGDAHQQRTEALQEIVGALETVWA